MPNSQGRFTHAVNGCEKWSMALPPPMGRANIPAVVLIVLDCR